MNHSRNHQIQGGGLAKCPAYKGTKKIVRISFLEGITIDRGSSSYATAPYGLARRPVGPPMQITSNQASEMAAFRVQLKALQEEVILMREATIPRIDKKNNDVAEDLASINEMRYIRQRGISTFETPSPTFTSYNYPPPSRQAPSKPLWFQKTKTEGKCNPGTVAELFKTLHQVIPMSTL